MNTDDLRTRMRAVFTARLSNSGKVALRRNSFDSAKENAVTNEPGCYGVLSKEINAVTPVRPFSRSKESLAENTRCSVCGAGGDLWHLGETLVHQECASRLPKPDSAEPTAAYRGVTAEPDGSGCSVAIVEIPATGLRYRRTFAHLQLRPPALVPIERWQRCVEDGRAFLHQWGEQAQAMGWTSADLFGLHTPPANPHPSYSRLSRYGCTGLVWLLQGRPVVALTADTAAIENPTGSIITTYRRLNKPSYGPVGDSLEDFES
jgi:hypothetical protein